MLIIGSPMLATIVRNAASVVRPLTFPCLRRRVVHFEDAKPLDEIRPSIRERVETSTEDDVLFDAVFGGASDNVFRHACADTAPSREREQRIAGQVLPQALHEQL